MQERKINVLKRTIPAYVFNETDKAILTENFDYVARPVIVQGKVVNCLEFEEDAFKVLDKIDSCYLLEADLSAAERRGLATRISTISFQLIRELSYINGNNLIEIGKSIKIVGRCVALAIAVGLCNLDASMGRRLLPLVRAI